MTDGARIRAAQAGEAAQISALAMRSKAYWGYAEDFMEACREELSYTAHNFENRAATIMVAENGAGIAGFYELQQLDATEYELTALFVEPAQIGSGIGRALLRSATELIADSGGGKLRIQGDPHAERFYRAAGGVLLGTRESGSIPGRYLPLFEISIEPAENQPVRTS